MSGLRTSYRTIKNNIVDVLTFHDVRNRSEISDGEEFNKSFKQFCQILASEQAIGQFFLRLRISEPFQAALTQQGLKARRERDRSRGQPIPATRRKTHENSF